MPRFVYGTHKRSERHAYGVVGSGGGAGYIGGKGDTGPGGNTIAQAGTSFLDGSLSNSGRCTGLAGNLGNGYVTVTQQ